MILSIVNKVVSNFFHFSAENNYLFGIHKIIALAGLMPVAMQEDISGKDANDLKNKLCFAIAGSGTIVINGTFGQYDIRYYVNIPFLYKFALQICVNDKGSLATRCYDSSSWSSWKQL